MPHLEADLPAAVLIVLHLGAGPASALAGKFGRAGALPAALAEDGEPLEPCRIYLAPPDRHTYVNAGKIRLTRDLASTILDPLWIPPSARPPPMAHRPSASS